MGWNVTNLLCTFFDSLKALKTPSRPLHVVNKVQRFTCKSSPLSLTYNPVLYLTFRSGFFLNSSRSFHLPQPNGVFHVAFTFRRPTNQRVPTQRVPSDPSVSGVTPRGPPDADAPSLRTETSEKRLRNFPEPSPRSRQRRRTEDTNKMDMAGKDLFNC